MSLEILIEDDRWSDIDLVSCAEHAYQATLAHLNLDPDVAEVSLLACDDDRIAGLNADFRGKPVPTNVLSWPGEDLSARIDGEVPCAPQPDMTGEMALGDIALAWETCACEAVQADKPLSDHVTHLIVHGLLHLVGYDHIRDRDATLMEQTETEILGTLGINDPYRDY